MPLDRKIKAYLKKRLKNIKKITSVPDNQLEMADYHKLRVEIKKLRAVMQFLQFCSKNFNQKELLKPIRKVFKSAGIIREKQLENEFLSKLSIKLRPVSLLEKNELLIHNELPNYGKLLKKKSFNSTLNSGKLVKKLKKVSDSKLKKYIDAEKENLLNLLKKEDITSEEIHRIRKYLKNLKYIEEMADLEISELRDLDELQDEIGKWHDLLVMSDKLKAYFINNPVSKVETRQLTKIYSDLNESSELKFREISKQFDRIKNEM